MNKAFNRKGKLSFKAAYPYQYVIAYFVKRYTTPISEIHSGYSNHALIDISELIQPT